MTNRQAEESELGAWSFWWWRGGGCGRVREGGGGKKQETRGEREMEASCAFAWLQRKHHLHQGMESKHAQDPYGYRPKKPPLLVAAEITDLLVMSHRFAYEDEYPSWIIFINIPLYAKNEPNWPTWMLFITALCLGAAPLVHDLGSTAYSWHEMTHFQAALSDPTLWEMVIKLYGTLVWEWSVVLGCAPHKSCISHSR